MADRTSKPKVVGRRCCLVSVFILLLLILCLVITTVVFAALYVYRNRSCETVATTTVSVGMVTVPVMSRNYTESDDDMPRVAEAKQGERQKRDIRLPTNLLPTDYFIEIKPHTFEPQPSDTFSGHVQITFTCTNSTDVITLHAYYITLKNTTIRLNTVDTSPQNGVVFPKIQNGGAVPRVLGYTVDRSCDFVMFQLSQPLDEGVAYTLSMNYTGYLAANLMGLYKSPYIYRNESRHVIVSQLAPAQARRVFPCFDEPSLKARFTVCIVRKPYMSSLSNMKRRVIYQREDDYMADVYHPTVLMSTYLVTFIVHDFTHKLAHTSNGVLIRVFSRPDVIEQASHALDVAVRMLPFYQDFFKESYPLPKLDMIAVPDFMAGAMENWGLVVYKESSMLYDAAHAPEESKIHVTVLVAHELAHQWFGNLVSPAWWDDIWLNEGFATYLEYIGTSHVQPQFKIDEEFLIHALHPVMDSDSFVTSHPVYRTIRSKTDIYEMFDTVSYMKGAALVRMLEFITGKNTFKAGMARYIDKLKYGIATHDHLWNALAKQSRKEGNPMDVKRIMDTWINQMNYPLLTVDVDPRDGSMVLSQERFLFSRPPNLTIEEYRWEIPVTYTNSDEQNFGNRNHVMLHTNEITKTISNVLPNGVDSWVIANLLQTGYYRVNYDRRNWDALITQLNTDHQRIHVVNRAQIISDAWTLAKAGVLDMSIALRTVDYTDKEHEFLPLRTAMVQLSYVRKMVFRTAIYGAFQERKQSQLRDRYLRTSWKSAGKTRTKLQLDIDTIHGACYYGLPQCTKKASNLFQQWMANPKANPIDRELRTFIYCTAIKAGGETEWAFLLHQYLVRIDRELRTFIYCTAIKAGGETEWEFLLQQYLASKSMSLGMMTSLTCTEIPYLLHRILEMVTEGTTIRQQDAANVMIAVSLNPIGTSIVWDYFLSRIDHIIMTMKGQMFVMTSLLRGMTSYFNTQNDLDKVKALLTQYPTLSHDFAVFNETLQRIQNNMDFMTRNSIAISDWLKKNT